jgi:hypothetical protein
MLDQKKANDRTDVRPLDPPLPEVHLPFDFEFFFCFFGITQLL